MKSVFIGGLLSGLLASSTLFAATSGPFINELHYDNSGGDLDEGVEIAGHAGADLSGWSLVFYNGSSGSTYNTVTLEGVIPDEQAGVGALWFGVSGLQNGSPDGIALVDAEGGLVQFLSYEGTFLGKEGPARNVLSEDLGVFEASDTGVGLSLQLGGSGMQYADFTWMEAAAHSRGSLNAGQSIAAVPLPAGLPLLVSGLVCLGLRRARSA